VLRRRSREEWKPIGGEGKKGGPDAVTALTWKLVAGVQVCASRRKEGGLLILQRKPGTDRNLGKSNPIL